MKSAVLAKVWLLLCISLKTTCDLNNLWHHKGPDARLELAQILWQNSDTFYTDSILNFEYYKTFALQWFIAVSWHSGCTDTEGSCENLCTFVSPRCRPRHAQRVKTQTFKQLLTLFENHLFKLHAHTDWHSFPLLGIVVQFFQAEEEKKSFPGQWGKQWSSRSRFLDGITVFSAPFLRKQEFL